jgi:hypothetical protein
LSEDEKAVVEVAQHLETLLQALVDTSRSTELHLDRLASESMSHKADLKRLTKVVIDGNGQPPILTRLALLEQNVQNTDEEIERFRSRWWQIVMMFLPGFLGAALGITTVM